MIVGSNNRIVVETHNREVVTKIGLNCKRRESEEVQIPRGKKLKGFHRSDPEDTKRPGSGDNLGKVL